MLENMHKPHTWGTGIVCYSSRRMADRLLQLQAHACCDAAAALRYRCPPAEVQHSMIIGVQGFEHSYSGQTVCTQ